MEVRVKQLGLAAYIKMNGAKLLGVENREFIFDTNKSVDDWRTMYTNSCCMKHDALVCELRQFLR